jgi:hypothetical protein
VSISPVGEPPWPKVTNVSEQHDLGGLIGAPPTVAIAKRTELVLACPRVAAAVAPFATVEKPFLLEQGLQAI